MGTKLRENRVSERLNNLPKVTQQSWDSSLNPVVPALSSAFFHYLDSILSSTSDYAILSFAPDVYKSIAVSDWLGHPTQLFNNDFLCDSRFISVVNSMRLVGKIKMKRFCLVSPVYLPNESFSACH